MEEAHYRLARIYKRSGENLKAQQELEVFDQLSKKRAEEVERERRQIQQFVYKLRDQTRCRFAEPPCGTRTIGR